MNHIYDLFAEILSKGVAYLLKQGLHKEYINKDDILPTLRGKLNIQGTIKEKIAKRTRLICEYDELTENNIYNQIIKTSLALLIHNDEVKHERKLSLRKVILFFDYVDEIRLKDISWSRLRYDRNNRTYQMLHSICYFIFQNQILSTEKGDSLMPHFSEDNINLLFQRFVMEYYKRHHPELKASSKQIGWNFCETDLMSKNILPIMQSDIFMYVGERILIIDTKFYGKNMQEHFGKYSIHSPNFYQIHTYVMNEDKSHTGKVDGMLLYARTNIDIQPECNFKTCDGNIIMVRTLDLSKDFENIKNQLDILVNYKELYQ